MAASTPSGSGIPSLLKVATWVFVAIFCTHIAVMLANRFTEVERASEIRIELKPPENVVQPMPLWAEYVYRAGETATLGTVLVCIGFTGWRKTQQHKSGK